VTAVTKSSDLDPLLADTPVDAALLGLTSTPICRLAELSRPLPSTLRLTTSFGPDISSTLTRVRSEASPYRALLAPLKAISMTSTGLELTLDGPAASFEKALCHPALSVAIAPYVKSLANAHHPEGRPYPDAVTVQRTDARTAERLLGQRRTTLVLGTSTANDAAQLFATYLVLPAGKTPPALRQAIEATTERADLTRFFVRAPASPLFGLLPAGLGGSTTAPTRPSKPEPQNPPREVTLAFDTASDDHRAIAEKLQVKLQPLGFRLSLRPLGHAELRTLWASGAAELMLQTVLLPTAPGAAMGLLWELSGQKQPSSLLAAPDLSTQDRLARDLALSARPTLGLIPLCVQGLGVSTTPQVQHLTLDAQGLPRLDDVFLSSD
jgi:MarR-like DNA-binding transcriptional regulator SgrR of sgrS sRNA